MAGAAVQGRLRLARWRPVARRRRPETPRAKTLVLDVPDWPGHRAGQHVDVRLTAEDGYQAQRSYSIASAPGRRALELTVERLDDGEVSPYLTDELARRRPLRAARADRRLLRLGADARRAAVARRRRLGRRAADGDAATARRTAARCRRALLYSSRSWEDVIYRDELDALAGADVEVVHTLTRSRPPGWTGFRGRIDADMLAEVASPPTHAPHIYVCGPTPFVEAVAETLVELGHDPADGAEPSASDRREVRWKPLDGNVAAGMLREVFALEVTAARGTCDGCGRSRGLGPSLYRGAGRASLPALRLRADEGRDRWGAGLGRLARHPVARAAA